METGDKVHLVNFVLEYDDKIYYFGYYTENLKCVLFKEEGSLDISDSIIVSVFKIVPVYNEVVDNKIEGNYARPVMNQIIQLTDDKPKVLSIESQMVDSRVAAIYLHELLKIAAEAGYTHVHDNWGHNAHDEYTIEEALKQFKPASDPHELPF